jgi:hypothetical protein
VFSIPGFLLLLLVLLGGAQAETVLYLRYGAGPKRTITNATETTPIRITTQSPHGFKAGDVVWIWGIDGNTNANGTRRVKQVLSPTVFTISYLNGHDAVGNGPFQSSDLGSWVGATAAYPVMPHPRLWLDGPRGEWTLRLRDPDGPGRARAPRATASNPPWEALSSWVESIGQEYAWNGKNFRLFRSSSFETISALALAWFSDQSRRAPLKGAKHWIANAERTVETLACDETAAGCGDATDIDYGAGYYTIPLALSYTLIHDQLTSAEIAQFTGMMLNDRTDGETCTPMYQPGDGAVVAAERGVPAGVLRGSGTSWRRSLAPGDTIYLPDLHEPRLVVSVESDTELHYRTTNLAPLSFTGKSYRYWVAHPWKEGNCGWAFWAKHSGYSPLSPYPMYPPAGGTGLPDRFSNQFLTKMAAFLMVGLATADDDPRGARLAEAAANWWTDVAFPLYQAYWTGPTQIDSQYGSDRFGLFTESIVWSLYQSTGGAVNYLRGNWLKNRAMFDMYEWLPTSGPKTWYEGLVWGTSALSLRNLSKTVDPAMLSGMYHTADEGKYLNFWMRHIPGYFNASGLRYGNCAACTAYYVFTDPSYPAWDMTKLPTARAFITTDAASACPRCNTDMIISRTGFTDSMDTVLHIMAVDVQRATNHLSSASNGSYNPGSYSIYKHNYLLAEDRGNGVMRSAGGYVNWDEKSNYFEVGGKNQIKTADGKSVIADVEVPRYGDGGTGPNQSKYMYALVDAKDAYTAAASLVRMHRHFVDFKGGSQQFIVVYDDVETFTGQMKRTYLHYPNNGQKGEGQTVWDGATNTVVSLDGPGGTALLTKVLFPGAPGFTYIDRPDGGYAGGVGQTFRVSLCAGSGRDVSGCDPNNRQAEFLVVHMPAKQQSAKLPAISLITEMDANFRGVAIGGPAPKAALFARCGMLHRQVTFAVPGAVSMQILIAGLEPGFYDVIKDGQTVVSHAQVNPQDNSLYFEASGGRFTITPRP